MCPAVRNNGPSADTIQSCALVAPECVVHVEVWSPYKSRACRLQPHLASGLLGRRGREESDVLEPTRSSLSEAEHVALQNEAAKVFWNKKISHG